MSRTRLLMAAAVALLLVTGAFFVATAPWGLPRLLCPSAPETVPVVVAAQDIPPYAVLTADMIKTRDLPRDLVPPGTLTKVEDALDRVVLTPLVKGEILLGNKLAPKGAGRGMGPILPEMLAFTIPVPSVAAGHADFIQPGNRVDVVQTAAGRGGSIMVLEDVQILAVAGNPVQPPEFFEVVLLVTPPQVSKLDLAQKEGRLRLVPHTGR